MNSDSVIKLAAFPWVHLAERGIRLLALAFGNQGCEPWSTCGYLLEYLLAACEWMKCIEAIFEDGQFSYFVEQSSPEPHIFRPSRNPDSKLAYITGDPSQAKAALPNCCCSNKLIPYHSHVHQVILFLQGHKVELEEQPPMLRQNIVTVVGSPFPQR